MSELALLVHAGREGLPDETAEPVLPLPFRDPKARVLVVDDVLSARSRPVRFEGAIDLAVEGGRPGRVRRGQERKKKGRGQVAGNVGIDRRRHGGLVQDESDMLDGPRRDDEESPLGRSGDPHEKGVAADDESAPAARSDSHGSPDDRLDLDHAGSVRGIRNIKGELGFLLFLVDDPVALQITENKSRKAPVSGPAGKQPAQVVLAEAGEERLDRRFGDGPEAQALEPFRQLGVEIRFPQPGLNGGQELTAFGLEDRGEGPGRSARLGQKLAQGMIGQDFGGLFLGRRRLGQAQAGTGLGRDPAAEVRLHDIAEERPIRGGEIRHEGHELREDPESRFEIRFELDAQQAGPERNVRSLGELGHIEADEAVQEGPLEVFGAEGRRLAPNAAGRGGRLGGAPGRSRSALCRGRRRASGSRPEDARWTDQKSAPVHRAPRSGR